MKFLNQPRQAIILLFLRIAFGSLAIAELIAQITYKRWYKGFYDPEEFRFAYIGFEWVQPFPEPIMSIFMFLVLAAAVCVLLGYRYKLATSFFALGFSYIYLLEKGLYLNHGYLFCWLSFVMIILPADRIWSLDLKAGRLEDRKTVPLWSIALPAALMAIVYWFGGIAKVNSDWLQGLPLSNWVGYKKDMWLLGSLWGNPTTGLVMAWSGMLLDLFAPFLLFWKRSRLFILILLILFHLTNALLFGIGIFPWLSLSLSALFFSSEWLLVLWNWLRRNFAKLIGWIEKQGRPAEPQALMLGDTHLLSTMTMTPIILLLIVHCILPLRHHAFPGDVAWTEEGHRYAWRMMLRHKAGKGHFVVKGDDDKIETIRPHKLMKHKLAGKMYTHPDMIWQTAQFLKNKYEKEGWKNVQVFANIKVRLNFREFSVFVDPEVDLAMEDWNFFEPKEWIFPEVRKEE